MTVIVIAVIGFGIMWFVMALLLSADDEAQENVRRWQRRNTHQVDDVPEEEWNGFSDPNDYPTDGCGENGW